MQVRTYRTFDTMQQSTTQAGWRTTSFGGSTDTSPMELDALGQHLSACRRQQGRFLTLRCVAERLHAYVCARMVTSLVVAVALLIGIGTLVLQGGSV